MRQRGFTLIELVLVIAIIGIAATLVVFRFGSFSYWQEQGFLRKFTETITFLHHQAVADQAFYMLDIDMAANSYKVGVIQPEDTTDEELADLAVEAGNLSLELAAFLNPSLGNSQNIIPPPGFPSLWDTTIPPEGVRFIGARNMRGEVDANDHAYIFFSPRRFSEFAVIHIGLHEAQEVTILVNPFTGTTSLYQGHREFEWTYGKKL